MDVTQEDEIRYYNLAAEIEQHIYLEFGDCGQKYKARVRSRVSNLGDLKNPDLCKNVVAGDITPSQIAKMTSEVSGCEIMSGMLYCYMV